MASKPEDGFDPSELDTAPGTLDLADLEPASPTKPRPHLTPAEAVEARAEAERPVWSPNERQTTGTRKTTGRRKTTGYPKTTGIRKTTGPEKKS